MAAALTLTGCTSTGDSASEQQSQQASVWQSAEQELEKQYGQEPPHSGAPAVDNPVDISDSVDDICDVLSAQDLRDHGISVEEPSDGTDGAYCDYEMDTPSGVPAGSPQVVTIASWDTLDQGISEQYVRAANDEFEEFAELSPMHGYPAVQHKVPDVGEDSCDVTVGMNDRQSFTITYEDGEQVYSEEPCGKAGEIAETAVENVRR